MPLDFRGQNLRGRSFRLQDLQGADFTGCDLSGGDFRNCNLREAKLDDALLLSTRFDGADLTGASLERVRTGRTRTRSAGIQIVFFCTAFALSMASTMLMASLISSFISVDS